MQSHPLSKRLLGEWATTAELQQHWQPSQLVRMLCSRDLRKCDCSLILNWAYVIVCTINTQRTRRSEWDSSEADPVVTTLWKDGYIKRMRSMRYDCCAPVLPSNTSAAEPIPRQTPTSAS
eukprot:2300052-Amphidinium_carterae.1